MRVMTIVFVSILLSIHSYANNSSYESQIDVIKIAKQDIQVLRDEIDNLEEEIEENELSGTLSGFSLTMSGSLLFGASALCETLQTRGKLKLLAMLGSAAMVATGFYKIKVSNNIVDDLRELLSTKKHELEMESRVLQSLEIELRFQKIQEHRRK